MGTQTWGIFAGLAVPVLALIGVLWNSERLPGGYRKIREISSAIERVKDDPSSADLSALLRHLTQRTSQREARPSRARATINRVWLLIFVIGLTYMLYGFTVPDDSGWRLARSLGLIGILLSLIGFPLSHLIYLWFGGGEEELDRRREERAAKRASRASERDKVVTNTESDEVSHL